MHSQDMKQRIKTLLRLDPVESRRNGDESTYHIHNEVLIPQVARYVEAGKTVIIPLRGNSMRPFLCHGRDKALLRKADRLAVGDPVLAEIAPKRYVLHRIVAIDGDNITLRGDGNRSTEHCRCGDVKAIAYGFLRKNRTTPDYTSSAKWKVYSWLWMRLLPFRKPLLYVHHFFFRSLKKLDGESDGR